MLLIELGYVFGIVHKILNNFNWVTWVYVVLFVIVGFDIYLYWRNRRYEREQEREAGSAIDASVRLHGG